MRFPGRARLAVAALAAAPAVAQTLATVFQVIPHPIAPRVDVLVRGTPFASYLFLTAMPRPALLPLHAPGGTPITPGLDDDPLAAARAGFWFAHGDVNGIDFSGSPREAPRGRIAHRRIVEAVSSDARGHLTVQTAWTAPGGAVLLVEDTSLTFRATDRGVVVDRVTRLGAVNGSVRLGATTLGQVGLQLAGGFRGREAIVGAAGAGTQSASASGLRARWLAIPGTVEGQPLAVALLDHPSNAGYPNWLRIGEANQLELAPAGAVTVGAQESVTFRYRLTVEAGPLNPSLIDAANRDFVR